MGNQEIFLTTTFKLINMHLKSYMVSFKIKVWIQMVY